MTLTLYRGVPAPPQSIQIMADLLRETGIDPAPAFASAGISPDIASNPLATVSGAAELAFQETFVELTSGRRNIWLELGLRSRFLMFGAFGVAVMTARTLYAALETARRLSWLHHSLAYYELETSGDLCTMRMRLDRAPEHLREFTALRDAPSTTDMFNVIWGRPFPFLEIELTVREQIDTTVRKPEAMVVKRGEPGAVWRWPSSLMEHKLPAADRRSHEQSLRQAELLLQRASVAEGNDDLAEKICALLQARGPGVSLTEMAAHLHVSPRTLQRRLSEAGASYRQLQSRERFNSARRLLRDTSLPVAEIAWRLGYTETSAFNHSFRRACGMSPRAWRKRSPQGAHPPAEVVAPPHDNISGQTSGHGPTQPPEQAPEAVTLSPDAVQS